MIQHDTVSVEKFYTDHQNTLGLKVAAGAAALKRIIREPTVNRPGLVLAGFTKYFAKYRVQVLGNAEMHFLKSLTPAAREERYTTLFTHRIPCLVLCREYRADRMLAGDDLFC